MANNSLISNTDTSKIFIWNNRFTTATYTNSTGSTVNLAAGRLMGRVLASNKVLPHASGASDGSQQPRFILANDYEVANGASVTVTLCDGGDVAKEKVIFGGSDAWTTVIGTTLGTIEDLLRANSEIKLVSGTELTAYDNQ